MSKLPNREHELTSFFEMTPDLVCIAGKDGFFININNAVIDKLEFTKEELLASPISSFIHPEDRQTTHKVRTELLGGKNLVNFQNRYVTKSGKIIWLHWTSVYFPETEVVFALAKDVTLVKLQEKDIEEKYIRFKQLASHYKHGIEKDKKYLALELHEELAQLASVIKLDLAWLNENLTDIPDEAKQRIKSSFSLIDGLVRAIQRISFSTSPDMLEDLGLNETLKWLCNEYAKMHMIPYSFTSNYIENKLNKDEKLELFRICQEALTNAFKHAKCTEVTVYLKSYNNNLSLVITDNGKGFNYHEKQNSFGLTNIRERVLALNGSLNIQSCSEKGTSIEINIP